MRAPDAIHSDFTNPQLPAVSWPGVVTLGQARQLLGELFVRAVILHVRLGATLMSKLLHSLACLCAGQGQSCP